MRILFQIAAVLGHRYDRMACRSRAGPLLSLIRPVWGVMLLGISPALLFAVFYAAGSLGRTDGQALTLAATIAIMSMPFQSALFEGWFQRSALSEERAVLRISLIDLCELTFWSLLLTWIGTIVYRLYEIYP